MASTQQTLTAVRAAAERHGRPVRLDEEFPVDPESLFGHQAVFGHQAFVELGGQPALRVSLFAHEEALVSLDGVDFDVPKASVAAFLTAVWSGLAHVRTRAFPPSTTLVVAVPGEPSYRAAVPTLTPWLAGIAR